VGIIVQNTGGSSVADVEKIGRVAARWRKRAQAVTRGGVSRAMGDTTDELLAARPPGHQDPHRRSWTCS